MLENEYKYLADNKDDIINNYKGFVILISGNQVIEKFHTDEDAYRWGIENIGLGKFLMQLVSNDMLECQATIYTPRIFYE